MAIILNNPQAEKNFKFNELKCKCGCESLMYNYRLVKALQYARDRVGSITVCSAYRCPRYNQQVGGATNSGHLDGNAADIKSKANIYTLAKHCYNGGCNRIGISDNLKTSGAYFVHAGIGTSESYWLYDSKKKTKKITKNEFLALLKNH